VSLEAGKIMLSQKHSRLFVSTMSYVERERAMSKSRLLFCTSCTVLCRLWGVSAKLREKGLKRANSGDNET